MGASPPTVNMADPAAYQELAERTCALARQGPLARFEPGGGWMVLRHGEVLRLLRDPRMRASGPLILEQSGIIDGPLYDWWKLLLFQSNPPVHERLRSLVNRAFTPRRVEAMRPVARRIAEELLDEATEARLLDVTERYAHEIPVRVIATMLGVPESDHALFGTWSNEIGLAFSPWIDPELRLRIEEAVRNFYTYVGDLIDERRARPRDDLVTALVAAEEAGDRLSEEELRAMVVNLLFAGHDTTKGLISIALMLLTRYPDEFARIQQEPALVESAVEEVLRFEPVVPGLPRIPSEPVEVCGQEIPAGAFVTLSIIAANRDPEFVEKPDVFDVGRVRSDHFSFGRGIHFCLGASLARLEAQEALRTAARRMQGLEFADGPPRWVPFAGIRRFESLRLKFDLR
jgi:cytochrome P450